MTSDQSSAKPSVLCVCENTGFKSTRLRAFADTSSSAASSRSRWVPSSMRTVAVSPHTATIPGVWGMQRRRLMPPTWFTILQVKGGRTGAGE